MFDRCSAAAAAAIQSDFGILCVRATKNIHLFIKENQRVCVVRVNRFRSVERKKKKRIVKNLLHANQNWNSSGGGGGNGVRLSFSDWPQHELAGFVRASGRRDYIIMWKITTDRSSHVHFSFYYSLHGECEAYNNK